MNKAYIVRNKDGEWLDSDYKRARRRGSRWTTREGARLYRSLVGVRAAIGWPTSLLEIATGKADPIFHSGMTRAQSSESWDVRRAMLKEVMGMKLEEYFHILARAGYEVVEVSVMY